jgi:hypothetical protein
VRPLREIDAPEGGLDIANDRAEVTPLDVRVDIYLPEQALVLDAVGRRSHEDVRDLAERHRTAKGGVHRQSRDRTEIAARVGRAPDVDVVGLPPEEEVADLLARDECRGGAADVAGLDPERAGLREVHLHRDLGDLHLELTVQVDDAWDAGEGVLDLGRLLAEDREV